MLQSPGSTNYTLTKNHLEVACLSHQMPHYSDSKHSIRVIIILMLFNAEVSADRGYLPMPGGELLETHIFFL